MSSVAHQQMIRYGVGLALTSALIALLMRTNESGSVHLGEDLRGKNSPDAFVIDGTYLSFDAHGLLSAQLMTPRAEQFEAAQTAWLDQPRGFFFEDGKDQQWRLRANDGFYDLSKSLLTVKGDVILVQTDGHTEGAQLQTSQLTFDQTQHQAYTQAPVTLLDAQGVTHAVGMRAWLDRRQLELQKSVNSRFVPHEN